MALPRTSATHVCATPLRSQKMVCATQQGRYCCPEVPRTWCKDGTWGSSLLQVPLRCSRSCRAQCYKRDGHLAASGSIQSGISKEGYNLSRTAWSALAACTSGLQGMVVATAKAEQHPLNVRIWDQGGKPLTWVELALAVSTLMLYVGWIHILLALGLLSFFYMWPRIVLALLFGTLLLPAKPVLWQAFNHSWMFATWRKYFKFSYLFEEAAKPDGHYVYVEFPHGVFPMGPLVAGSLCQVLFPDFQIYSLAASSVFTVPFWRHFVAWLGSQPATSRNFRQLLRTGSVAVIVGGIAEMFLQDDRKEQIMLKDRKGFVRIAIEEGATGIVPVYHFGNTQLLDIWPASLQQLSRSLKAACGVFYGFAGLPLPRHKEVFMVTGKAIPVTKMARDDPGFAAEVDRVHGLVMQAVQDLYDRHKADFGWKDRPLVIL